MDSCCSIIRAQGRMLKSDYGASDAIFNQNLKRRLERDVFLLARD